MTDRDRLRDLLNRRQYLVIDVRTNEARLESAKDVLGMMGGTAHLILDLQSAFRDCEKLTDLEEFTLDDIAHVAGVNYPVVFAWMQRGILRPSIREPEGAGKGRGPRFSFADAVAAATIGTLRRTGLSLQVVKAIGPLLNATMKQKNRPPGSRSSERS